VEQVLIAHAAAAGLCAEQLTLFSADYMLVLQASLEDLALQQAARQIR